MKRIDLVAIWLLASCLPCAALAATAPAGAAPVSATTLPRDSVYQLQITLTDQDGQSREWQGFRGKPRLVAMFYTSCQYICPLIIDAARSIERGLTPKQLQNLGVVFISIDPARDTPAMLNDTLVRRRLDPTRWTLVAPPLSGVRDIAAILDVRFRQLADGEFNHTSALTLLDADGRIIARTEQMGSKGDPGFLDAVRRATDGGP